MAGSRGAQLLDWIDGKQGPGPRRIAARRAAGFIVGFAVLLTLALYLLDWPEIIEQPFWLPILNTVFITLASLVVAYLAARSYVRSGRPNLLLAGSAVLMFGITSSISGWWTAINPNIGVTIYNTGHLQVDYETVDLAALVTAAVQDAQLGARRHTLHYAGPAKGVLVQGNALRLEQVLQNLLQNAVKYTPFGGDIEITLSIAEGMARLAVKDEGIGMPPAALPHIFTRFYRAANAEAHHISGPGIGLYVSREITRLYGGDIDVKSTEGVGTTMTVCLPVVEIPNKEQTIDP